MSVIARNQNWVDGEVLFADVLDGQFDKLYNLLTGVDIVNGLYLRKTTPINLLSDPALLVGGQLYIEHLSGSGAVLRIYHSTDLVNPTVDIANLGWIKMRGGSAGATPSVQSMYASGCLYNRSNNIGNIGAGEDDLQPFTIGANVFGTGGSPTFATVRYRGRAAANANNKRFRFYGKTTVLMDSGVIVENNVPWFLDAEIMPDGDAASTVTVSGIFRCGATEVRFNSQLAGYDFTIDNAWKMTAEAIATDDIVNNMMIVDIGRGLN